MIQLCEKSCTFAGESETSGGTAVLTKVDALAANNGYLINYGTTTPINFKFYTGVTPPSTNYLKGSITDAVIPASPANTYYVLTGDTNGNNIGFYWPNGSASAGASFTNAAGKAYLAVPKIAGGRKIMMVFGGNGTTGIENLSPTLSEGDGGVYTLQGVRISPESMKKGVIYIINGKKTIKQ